MKLTEFPTAIKSLEQHLLNIQRKIRTAQIQVDSLIADIDNRVAFDPDLKNENQRRAKRLELMQQELVQESIKQLQWDKDNANAVQIELELVRNQFSVAKLSRSQKFLRKENRKGVGSG